MPKRFAAIGPHEAALLDYEDSLLAPNQVRVQTELASGKHGTMHSLLDSGVFVGQQFDREKRIFVEGETGLKPASPDNPHKLGTTAVGTISEVGSEVTNWQVGNRVFGLMDTKSTNTMAADGYLWALGEVDPLLALCVEPAYVSFHCLREANLRYGDTVVVIGLGALGLLAVRMAVESGAEAVFAVDTLPKRREKALEYGANAVFDPTEGDTALAIHDLTSGKGVDVAIELAGVYPALHLATRCVRMCGTVCAGGFYQGEAKGMWLGREFHHNRLNVVVPHGCGFGHVPRDYPRWDERRAYDSLVSLMRQGKLTAPGLIDPLVPAAEGPEVFRRIQEDPGSVLKFGLRF